MAKGPRGQEIGLRGLTDRPIEAMGNEGDSYLVAGSWLAEFCEMSCKTERI